MQGCRRLTGRLLQSLGRPASGRGQSHGQPLAHQRVDDATNDRGLAHARPARNHQQRIVKRAPHRLGLLWRKYDAGLGLVAGDGTPGVDAQGGAPGMQQAQQARACRHFGAKQPHLEHRRALWRALDSHVASAA